VSTTLTVQLHGSCSSIASTDGSDHSYPSLIYTTWSAFCHLHCVELWYKHVKCSLFSSTCTCSSSASPNGNTRSPIDLQGRKSQS